MVIPASNFDSLAKEDLEFFMRRGLSVIPALGFWEIAKIALASHPDKEVAIRKLTSQARSSPPTGTP
jgi:hypothetical protein